VGIMSGASWPGFVSVEYPADWSAPPATSIPQGKSGPAQPIPNMNGQAMGTIAFGSGGSPWTADIRFSMDQYRGARIINAWVNPAGTEALAKSTGARIERPGQPPIEIAWGALPWAALEGCRLHILREWGVDPARLVIPPESASSWFANADFPAAARRQGAQGRVAALLGIGEDGVIKSCRVVMSTGSRELDDTTCTVALTRGSFAPAPKAGDRYAIIRTVWRLQNQ